MDSDIEERFRRVEGELNLLKGQVTLLYGSEANHKDLIRFVIVPLLGILAALIGLKSILP